MTEPRIGVVLVTHNSGQSIGETLDSISKQTLRPARVLVVDDDSVDDTKDVVNEWSCDETVSGIAVDLVPSTSRRVDTFSRIAGNFTQGLRAMTNVDLVALGDHDDVWMPNRLEIQSTLMEGGRSILLANDGRIQNSLGTLFDAFDVPSDVEHWDPRNLLRHVLRHSVAVGGASMVDPRALSVCRYFVPPPGWLHDRWWSILAAAQGRLQVSWDLVISYRLSAEQSVGLDRGRQHERGLARLASAGFEDIRKAQSLHGLKEEAAPELRGEFAWGRLLRSLI